MSNCGTCGGRGTVTVHNDKAYKDGEPEYREIPCEDCNPPSPATAPPREEEPVAWRFLHGEDECEVYSRNEIVGSFDVLVAGLNQNCGVEHVVQPLYAAPPTAPIEPGGGSHERRIENVLRLILADKENVIQLAHRNEAAKALKALDNRRHTAPTQPSAPIEPR